jgi:hypothetical protein
MVRLEGQSDDMRISVHWSIFQPECSWYCCGVLLGTRGKRMPLHSEPKLTRVHLKRYFYPCSRPWRPIRMWDVEDPTFSRLLAHRWRWVCQPYELAALYSPGRSLVLISVRGWFNSKVILQLGGLGKSKKSMSSSGIEPATFRLVA